jgi:hypothetical protein
MGLWQGHYKAKPARRNAAEAANSFPTQHAEFYFMQFHNFSLSCRGVYCGYGRGIYSAKKVGKKQKKSNTKMDK